MKALSCFEVLLCKEWAQDKIEKKGLDYGKHSGILGKMFVNSSTPEEWEKKAKEYIRGLK